VDPVPDPLRSLYNIIPSYILNTIKKVQENWMILESNGTHQLLVNADDANFFRDNMNPTKRNSYPYNKETGEVNTEKTVVLSPECKTT
jgi:hypothetical protein